MPKVRAHSFFHSVTRRASCAASFAAALLGGSSALAATEVWTGATGNWSTDTNWLDGTAPTAGGDQAQALRFTYGGTSAATFTNDLAGTFLLNSLLLDSATPGSLTLAGAALQFSGATPQIAMLGSASLTVSENLVLSPASGAVSITGSGSGGLTLSGTIGESGGARSLVVASSPVSPNVQSISLSGTNTFSGGVVLQSGNLFANSAAALGGGPLTVQGGSLRIGSFTYANAISLEHSLLLQTSATNTAATFGGVISSAVAGAGLDLRAADAAGSTTLSLTAASTYSGPTTVDISPTASLAASPAGILRFTGSGSALNSASFSIATGGLLQLDAAASGTVNRVGDAAAINLLSGKLSYVSAGSSTAQVETFGALNGSGYSTVNVTNTSSVSVRLAAASLNRLDRGTFLFSGSSLGSTFGSGVGNILFTSAPVLVGGGGTGANTSILPYAVGSSSANGTGTSLLTYSATTGVRTLIFSEYATDLATAQATNNVSLTTGGTVTNSVARTINSLVVGGTIDGAGSLAITSGMLLTISTSTIANDLAFGTREANLFQTSALTVTGAISGSGGLTSSGTATLTLTGNNTFTGPLTINSGTLAFNSPAALGNDTSALVVNGRTGKLTYTGAAPLSLARGLDIKSGVFGVTNSGGDLTLAGNVTGSGGLILTGGTGRITLGGANNYTGPTLLAGGTVQFGSDAALGTGGAIDFQGGTALLSGNWTTAREISVSTGGTLDTGGFSAVWNGEFSGAGTFAKAGQGELAFNSPTLYANKLTVSEGTVRFAGTATSRSSSYSVGTNGGLVLDNRTAVVADRINNGAQVVMLGGDFRLIGNAAAPVSESVFLTPAGDNAGVTLESPGAFGTTLHLTTGFVSSSFLLRGANLGGAAGTAFTRVVNDSLVVSNALLLGVVATSSITGAGDSFTMYDATSDAAGVIGYRPVSAADYTSGNVLRNPANGGTVSTTAHFLAGSGSVAVGTANTVQTLTLEGGADLTLASDQTLTVTSGGILARAGATPTTISGGTIAFPGAGLIYAAGETTLASQVTGTSFKKVGPGQLNFNGTLGDQVASVSASFGTLRAGANDPFATQIVTLTTPATLSFASSNATVGGLSGGGNVDLGNGTVTVGNKGADMTFGGILSGTGNLVITDGGNSSALRAFIGGGTFSGKVILNSGRLSLLTNNSLGHSTLVVNGGSVRAWSQVFAGGNFDAAIELHTDLTVLGSSAAFSLGPNTTVTGAYDVVVRGSGGLEVQGPLSLPANLRATYGPDDEFVNAAGTITLDGSQGALVQAAGVQLNGATTLRLDHSTAFAGGAGGRLGDSIPVQLTGATLLLVGNSVAGGVTETVGALSGAGQSTLSITQGIGVATTLQAASLSRVDHGTFLLSVSSGGLGGTGTTSGGKIKVTAAPALVGGGGTGLATSVVPWAFTQDPTLGYVPLTYDANGFRPLVSSEMQSNLASAAATDNVRQTSSIANAATLTLNSLTLAGTSTLITGAGALNLTSGLLISAGSGAPVISNQLNFGAAEAQFFVQTNLPVLGVISGSGGLTKSGTAMLTLGAHNTFTGPLTVNGGTLAFLELDNLGADQSTITLTGSTSTLRQTSLSVLTLNRPIRLGGGLPLISSAGTLTLAGPISGPGGLQLQTTGTVQLVSGNTYAGPTFITGNVAIADDSALGAGTGLFLNTSTLQLTGDWMTARRVQLLNTANVDTNGHQAVLNGPLVTSTLASLRKMGAGTLTLTGNDALTGLIIQAGELRLGGAGVVVANSYSVSGQSAFVIDNTTTALGNRLSATAGLTLSGGSEFRLLGNSSAGVLTPIGALSSTGATANLVTLTAPGTASAILQASSLNSPGVLVVRGDALGGGPTGGFTRLVATTAPTGFAALAANTSAAGASLSLAIYDPNSDAAGVIGVRPLGAGDFIAGAEIRNPLNGGATPVNANFRATGATTAGGAANSVNTLTFAGTSSVSMATGQTLSLLTSGVLVETGGSATITGGSLAFTGGSGFFHTEGDLTVQSAVTSPILSKSGPGLLVFGPSTPYAGTFNLIAGSVRAGSANALGGATLTMNAGTTLDFASQPASLASLKGTGTVTLGSSILQLAADSSFTGDLSGTGGLTTLGTFEPFTPVSYTGPTTAGKSFFLRAAGTALGSSSFTVLAGGLLQLDNSTQVLSRISVVPVTVNSGTFELIGNTGSPVTLGAGLLTGSGASVVRADATGARLPVALNFAGLARQDHGTFSFSAGATPAVLGGGQSTLTFGSALTASLVGANTTATNRPILPFAVANDAAGAANLVTYDPMTGIRPLIASEYSSTLSTGDNVLITSSLTSNTNDTINALVMTGGTMSGSGTLSITSGTIVARSSGQISRNIDYGSREAIFLGDGSFSVDGVISGSGGLTKSGTGQLTLSRANTFTGPLTINQGILSLSSLAGLGLDTSEIVMNGATLNVSTIFAPVVLTRPLRLNGGTNVLVSQNSASLALTIPNPITGTGGLRQTGYLVLTGANSFTGNVEIDGTLVLNSDAALGLGNTLLLGGGANLLPTGPMLGNRAVQIISPGAVTLDTGKFDASFGSLASSTSATFNKKGTGRLSIGTAAAFAGELSIQGGSVRLDNTAAVADRFGDSATITLQGGELELIGHASLPTNEVIGTLNATSYSSRLTSIAPGSAPTTLRFGQLTGPLITIRAAGLGEATGAYQRILFSTVPTIVDGAVPGVLLANAAGDATSLATYDSSSDAVGVIGLRPLSAAGYESSAPLANASNGGATPLTANFRATGPLAVKGASNTIKTLSLAGGASLALAATQTLTVSSGVIIVEPGSPGTTISGGTIGFGTANDNPGEIFAGSDVTIGSALTTTAGLAINGNAVVTLAAPARFTGSVQINHGTLLLGADNALLTTHDVAVNPGGTLALAASRSVNVGILTGSGSVTLGAGADLSVDSQSVFTGAITGPGGFRVHPFTYSAGFTLTPFTVGVDYAHTGPTTVEGAILRLNGTGRLTATSSIEARSTGTLQLRTAAPGLPVQVPLLLTNGTLDVQTGTANLSLGPLTARGLSNIKIDHTTAAVQLDFAGLTRSPEGAGLVFNMSSAAFGTAPGAGVANIRFGGNFAAQLIGAGGTPEKQPVVPFMIAGYANPANPQYTIYNALTYDPANGLRPLSASEYTTTLVAGANVRLIGSTNNATFAINSLFQDGSTLNGTGTLQVASGLVVGATGPSIYNNLDFGNTPGNIFATEQQLGLYGKISGTAGLTLNSTVFQAAVAFTTGNLFSGPLTLNRTMLDIQDATSLGVGNGLITFNGTEYASNGFYQIGIHNASSNQVTLSRAMFLGSGEVIFNSNSFITPGSLVLNGPISGPGGLYLPDTITLGGQNSYTGTTTILGQTTITTGAAFGQSSQVLLSGGTMRFGAGLHLASPAAINGGSIDTNGFNVTLDGALSLSGPLQKLGGGILTIANPGTYVGALTVAAGEVRMDGTAPASGSLTVNAGATFSGTVQTTRTLSVSGTLAPGDGGAGSLGSGALSLQTNSTLALELGPTGSDQVQVTGSVTLAGTVNLALSLSFGRTDVIDQFTIILNDGTDAVSGGGRLAYLGNTLDEGEAFTVAGQQFLMSYVGGSGNDVVLYAVPEPGHAALLMAGALGLAAARRRRKRVAAF
ncbi:MAG TPA: autotransporter-associated beta strand repeat-containing protein [Chthoniobacteraceae bacterium]|nr:autotransporter-associated beta strand repeat-containing protein [Chthoniobacteraceae bacterium]